VKQILAVYGTAYGQTEKIVRRIADVAARRGVRMPVVRADDLPREMSLDPYDGYLVAGSVIRGRHQRSVQRFVRRNARRLAATPSAFISVSGAAMGISADDRAEVRRYVDEFVRKTGWRPPLVATFAGALPYTRYNFVLRWVMQRIARKRGQPTDTTRDYEFTDWEAVDRFAADLSRTVAPAVEPAAR
jgi:menaquinone-dependent protoporphyrinogen oxidase